MAKKKPPAKKKKNPSKKKKLSARKSVFKNTLSTVYDPLLSGKEIQNQTDGKLTDIKLRQWRSEGTHADILKETRIGSRVYYRQSVIEAFLAGSTAH